MIWPALFSILLGLAAGLNLTLEKFKNHAIYDAQSGYIMSPGYANGTGYPRKFYGQVRLTASQGFQYLRLDFEDIDLDVASICGGDRIDISEPRGSADIKALSLCGSNRPNPWKSLGKTVKIVFSSDKIQGGRGFKIRYRAVNDFNVCDSKGLYQCRNRNCIRSELACNGRYDCSDGSDEEFCESTKPNSKTPAVVLPQVPCGTPVVSPLTSEEDRVVGGQQAIPHSWPWQVSLQHSRYDILGHFCGGSLISNKWVVTAAHCVKKKFPSDITVKLGVHSQINKDGVITRQVKSLVVHPNYNILDNNDIALVELKVPVNFTDTVRPVCMPEPSEKLPVGTTCYTTGWGQTRGSGDFENLKQVKLKTLPFDSCEEPTNPLIKYLNDNLHVCAGDEHQRENVCHGDSGGPLVCEGGNKRWVLHGVTSLNTATSGSATVCGSSAFWTRVQAQRRWIDNTIRVL